MKAIHFALFWLREEVEDPNESGVIGRVHHELYTKLREGFHLPSKVAEDCYRNALSIYKNTRRRIRTFHLKARRITEDFSR